MSLSFPTDPETDTFNDRYEVDHCIFPSYVDGKITKNTNAPIIIFGELNHLKQAL